MLPIPGAGETLATLADSWLYFGVVSNKKSEFLRIELAHLGWDRFFGALDAKRDKPAPVPVDMALRQNGIERGPRVWMAGEADIDLECARNAGCTSILVRARRRASALRVRWPPTGPAFSGVC